MKESRSSRDKKQKKKKTNKDDEKSSRKIQKKAKKKEKKRREKELKKQIKLLKNRDKKKQETVPETLKEETEIEEDCGPSIDLMNRAKCPETKEQWELRQSVIKRVVDPETGRTRLIKGDGEILEEMVTRDRHMQINKDATRNDGHNYQLNTVGSSRRFK